MNNPTTLAPAAPRASSYVLQQAVRAFSANATSWVGLVIFLFVVALALLAPVISPYDPLNQRDYTVLQGMMVVYAFAIVLVNLLTDLTYGFIDPRVKRQ